MCLYIYTTKTVLEHGLATDEVNKIWCLLFGVSKKLDR